MQISLYLLCFLLFGELTSAKYLIFTVLFVIWRAKECKLALRGVFADLSEPAQIQLNRLRINLRETDPASLRFIHKKNANNKKCQIAYICSFLQFG